MLNFVCQIVPCVVVIVQEGTKLFRKALEEGYMESYFYLSECFTTQAHPAYCGYVKTQLYDQSFFKLRAIFVSPTKDWFSINGNERIAN